MKKPVNLNIIHARGKSPELLAVLSGGLVFKKTVWKILPILLIIILAWKVKSGWWRARSRIFQS